MFESLFHNTSLNYAAFAIPAFFIFLGIEYAAAIRSKQKHLFKFNSSIANLSIGIAERLLNLFLAASFYELFMLVYKSFAIWSIPNHWLVWVVLLLATDLVWYWYHRLGHEVNLLWAAHIVHHHSEEFNYTVSARITTLQSIVRNLFWCVLPLMGFHPSMVMTILVIHGAYSFFTHTQLINKLGWFENVFITPSHHRVHHASNEKYLNKNYGDLFVFWDKLFGTFQQEDEKPSYGLTHPLKNHSFLWQHFHYFIEILYAISLADGFFNKVKIIFGKPELLNQNIRAEVEHVFLSKKENANFTFRYKGYLVIQLSISIILVFCIILFYNHIDSIEAIVASLFIIITMINCGALLEQRKWIYYIENTRLLLLVTYLSYEVQSAGWFVIACLLIAIFSYPMRAPYLKLVYGTA